MRSTLVLSALIALATPLAAQRQITTANPQGWFNATSRDASVAQIGDTYDAAPGNANTADGALDFYVQNNSKETWNYLFPSTQSLSALTSASFDWLQGSSTTTLAFESPSYQLLIESSTGTLLGSLNWEYVYNDPGNAAAPQDQFVHTDMATQKFWQFDAGAVDVNCTSGGPGPLAEYTLSQWSSGSNCLPADVQVYGVSMNFGGGVAGEFYGAVDNVNIAFGTQFSENDDFVGNGAPSSATPEPATISLMATGLVGLAGLSRRKRRR